MQTNKPRYSVRHNNQTNHVFDNVYYGVVGAHRNSSRAQQRADELNVRHAEKRAPERK